MLGWGRYLKADHAERTIVRVIPTSYRDRSLENKFRKRCQGSQLLNEHHINNDKKSLQMTVFLEQVRE